MEKRYPANRVSFRLWRSTEHQLNWKVADTTESYPALRENCVHMGKHYPGYRDLACQQARSQYTGKLFVSYERSVNFHIVFITRNTCMQQPLAYILQTLFQHEVFVITPTMNAGSRCSRHVSHGNTIIAFFIFCTNLKPAKIDQTWTLLNTELSISKIYKVGILFWFLWAFIC
jgi:hypothetical protein